MVVRSVHLCHAGRGLRSSERDQHAAANFGCTHSYSLKTCPVKRTKYSSSLTSMLSGRVCDGACACPYASSGIALQQPDLQLSAKRHCASSSKPHSANQLHLKRIAGPCLQLTRRDEREVKRICSAASRRLGGLRRNSRIRRDEPTHTKSTTHLFDIPNLIASACKASRLSAHRLATKEC